MNYRLTAGLLSRLFLVLAVAMCAAAPWAWSSPDHGGADGLIVGATIATLLAVLLAWIGRRADATVRVRDALFVVTVGWLAAGVLGAVPYVVSGGIPHLADAFFETVSGFTTTGSTILTDIEALPPALHMWRAMTHWLGGLGIVVLFVALFPQLGVGAKHLFKSEVPGPVTEGLRPKIKQTAVALWWIYLVLTAAETVLLMLADDDMDLFQAVCHSMSTMATGGFSTRAGSVEDFHSPAVEWIICFFMLCAGINFGLYYAAITGKARHLFRDAEWRAYIGIVLVASLVIAGWLMSERGYDVETALRKSTFQVLAIVTTTGFGTDDWELWPAFCQLTLVFLMFVGGSAGSTAGGMKVSRVVILLKAAWIEVAHTARPHAVRLVKLGRSAISNDVLKQVIAYAVIFFTTVAVCGAYVAWHGVDVTTAFSSALTCVANVGPGLGEVGPTDNFAFLPADCKLVLALAMILGRLEFFTALALLMRSTWRP